MPILYRSGADWAKKSVETYNKHIQKLPSDSRLVKILFSLCIAPADIPDWSICADKASKSSFNDSNFSELILILNKNTIYLKYILLKHHSVYDIDYDL